MEGDKDEDGISLGSDDVEGMRLTEGSVLGAPDVDGTSDGSFVGHESHDIRHTSLGGLKHSK